MPGKSTFLIAAQLLLSEILLAASAVAGRAAGIVFADLRSMQNFASLMRSFSSDVRR